MTALAVGVSVLVGAPHDISSEAWIALALLGTCGAVAHLFPVRSARGGATYTLTNVFLIAGAACLPLSLCRKTEGVRRWSERTLEPHRAKEVLDAVRRVCSSRNSRTPEMLGTDLGDRLRDARAMGVRR